MHPAQRMYPPFVFVAFGFYVHRIQFYFIVFLDQNGSKLTVLLNGDAVYHSNRHCSSLHVHINRRPQSATLICSTSTCDSDARVKSGRSPPPASAHHHQQPTASTVQHIADLAASFASLSFAVRAQLLVMHQLLERCRARCGKIVCEFGLPTAVGAAACLDGRGAAARSSVSGACALMENDEGDAASCRGDTRLELCIPIGSGGNCCLQLLWLHRPAAVDQRLHLIAAAFVSARVGTAGESEPQLPPPILSAHEQCWTAEQLGALPSLWWSPDSGEQQQAHASDSTTKLDTDSRAWNAFFASLGGSQSQLAFFFHQMRRVVCRTSAAAFPHVVRLHSRDYIALQWHAIDRESVERALHDVLQRKNGMVHHSAQPMPSTPVM